MKLDRVALYTGALTLTGLNIVTLYFKLPEIGASGVGGLILLWVGASVRD